MILSIVFLNRSRVLPEAKLEESQKLKLCRISKTRNTKRREKRASAAESKEPTALDNTASSQASPKIKSASASSKGHEPCYLTFSFTGMEPLGSGGQTEPFSGQDLQQIEDLKSRLAKKQVERSALEDQLSKEKAQIAEQTRQLVQLKRFRKAEIEKHQKDMQHKVKKIHQLTEEQEEMKQICRAQSESLRGYDFAIAGKKEEIARLQATVARLTRDYDILRAAMVEDYEFVQLGQELAELKEKLQSKETQLREAQKRLRQVENTLREEAEKKELQATILFKELQISRQNLSSQKLNADHTSQALKVEIAQLKQELCQAIDVQRPKPRFHHMELQKVKKENEAERCSLEQIVKNLEAKLQKLSERFSQLTAEKAELSDRITTAERQAKNSEESREVFKRELEKRNRYYTDLSCEMDQHRLLEAQTKLKLNGSQQRNQTLEAELETLKSTNETLNSNLQAVTEELEALKTANAESENELPSHGHQQFCMATPCQSPRQSVCSSLLTS